MIVGKVWKPRNRVFCEIFDRSPQIWSKTRFLWSGWGGEKPGFLRNIRSQPADLVKNPVSLVGVGRLRSPF
ncbi:MAG TPA: hypothetical protein DGO89_14395 [Microcoleaceae bacterium UBA9251]|nr:hypothetical protein [Microcoleaceae cyanobacterium UBA9251]